MEDIVNYILAEQFMKYSAYVASILTSYMESRDIEFINRKDIPIYIGYLSAEIMNGIEGTDEEIFKKMDNGLIEVYKKYKKAKEEFDGVTNK